MFFKLLILMLAFLGLAFSSDDIEPQADDIIYSPHGILYTNTLHNFYTAGRCTNQFKFRRNYLKNMLMGYRSFKQDNDNEHGILQTVFVDTNLIGSSGDTTPKPMVYNKWYTWFSNRECTLSHTVPCGLPGLCSDNPWADMFINLISSIFHAASNPKKGYYCAGSHGEDSLYDCCSGLLGDGGVYKLVRSGWTMRRKDGTGDAHEMPFLYVSQGNKKMIIECKGDDIWFQDWQSDQSFAVFTPQGINGNDWYYRSPDGRDFTNSPDMYAAIENSCGYADGTNRDKMTPADNLWDASGQRIFNGRN